MARVEEDTKEGCDPFEGLTHEQLAQLRGMVLAVELGTHKIVAFAATMAKLEALMKKEHPKVEWGSLAGPPLEG